MTTTPVHTPHPLERNGTLIVFSVCATLLASFHIADDVVRGFEPGGFRNAQAVLTLSLWLSSAVVLGGKRSGQVLMLLGAILGMGVSIAHMRGVGLVGGRLAGSSGLFFWVWTIHALGVTSVLTFVLAVRALLGRPDPFVRIARGGDR